MNESEQLRGFLDLLVTEPKILIESYLTEAKGIGNRKPGDKFVPKDPKSGLPDIRVDEVNFYPQGGKLIGDEWIEQFDEIEEMYPNIVWVNNSTNDNTGGFGVASFSDDRGNPVVYGKFFKKVHANNALNAWHNQNGLPDYRFGGKAARKSDAGLEPADVLTRLDNLTSDDIIEQIAVKFGDNHPFTNIAEQISQGADFPLSIPAIEGMPFEAFRDGFTELLHPIALQSGTYTGNAEDAEEIFLTQTGFAEAGITFNMSKTQGLSDSMFTNSSGERLQVSSKGGTTGNGAMAGVQNLADALDEMRKTNLPAKFYKDNATAIHLIETISNHSAYEGPVALGIQYGLIDQADANLIRNMREPASDGDLSYIDVRDGDYLNKKLKEIYLSVSPTIPERADSFNTMVFSLAKRVAEEVNKTSEFSKAASAILNNSALVQVYTKAKVQGDEWVITDFNSKFPSSAVTEVLLSSKNYATTKNNGKYAFSIGKDGASAQKEVKKGPTKPKTTKKEKQTANKQSTQARKRAEFKKPKTNSEVFGREKSSMSRDRDNYDNWFDNRFK